MRRRNPSERVRTWSSFRQGRKKPGRTSLNLELLQSGEEETRANESELGAPSDRGGRNPGERVRTWCFFRHGRKKPERASLNLALLQTREEEIRANESELGAPSDRGGRNPSERVRTWRSFGQREEKTPTFINK
ncbi:hypothetical protein [Cytobacillus firmus]|uniref:hypothetical protein n=1 Tax=Cytobacillus firmus TaxID=1399 RepID=UPI0022283DB6|nr:hypothetical protein [Cytobacillus firmus]